MEFKSYSSLSEALIASKKFTFNPRKRKVNVLNSVGYYSYEDILSPDDFPRYSKSAVDGYAIQSRNTISSSRINPSFFRVVGESSPEKDFEGVVKEGEAVKIYTGGKLPEGTDSVVMMEDTEILLDNVRIFVPVRKFQNVSLKGEDIERGYVLVRKGKRITPPHIVAFLEVGIKNIEVYDFRIGIISTGNEIVNGKVINSTQPLLKEYLKWNGFEADSLGTVGDDEDEIRKKIEQENNDIFIITGGTGPSDRDVLSNFLENNATKIFHGLKIRPARTSGLFTYGNKPIFVFSGLPVAALIAVENIFLPIISQWTGIELNKKNYVEGQLSRSIVNTLGFRSFVRVKIDWSNNPPRIIPIRVTGSGVIYSIIDADGILEVDENNEGFQEGDTVKVHLLRW